jgi:uncharacterized phage protein (predicted DNA packaging)
MLEKVKKSMRISHNAIDDDITLLIETCLKDLEIAGINTDAVSAENDPLLCTACILYVKWMSDFTEKADQYEKAYQNLKISLSLCGDYDVQ